MAHIYIQSRKAKKSAECDINQQVLLTLKSSGLLFCRIWLCKAGGMEADPFLRYEEHGRDMQLNQPHPPP